MAAVIAEILQCLVSSILENRSIAMQYSVMGEATLKTH